LGLEVVGELGNFDLSLGFDFLGVDVLSEGMDYGYWEMGLILVLGCEGIKRALGHNDGVRTSKKQIKSPTCTNEDKWLGRINGY
jgi:hypothetical protein